MRRWIGIGLGGAAAVVLAIQFVPYGRGSDGQRPGGEPAWDAPQTRELARRACFDCHSAETRWPVYASVAPVSWLVRSHVDEGRAAFDVQAGPQGLGEAEEAAETVAEGEMPPAYYTLLHPEARLSAVERQALIDGLTRTFGGAEGHAEADEEDE
jgi:hypothetical protein